MLCKNYTKRKYLSKNYKEEKVSKRRLEFLFFTNNVKYIEKREVKFTQMDSQENKMTIQGHQD